MRRTTIFVVFAGFLVTANWAGYAAWMCAYHTDAAVLAQWRLRFYVRSALALLSLALGVALVFVRRKRVTK